MNKARITTRTMIQAQGGPGSISQCASTVCGVCPSALATFPAYRFLKLLVGQLEQCFAVLDVARFEALLEPAGSLGGGAVGKQVGTDGSAGRFLKAVVA